MLEKKLVTLLCAAGILACGACFLPPLPQRPPPPPPPHLDLQGIQSIRVEVTNNSESRHLDPSDLAQAVVNNINSNWRSSDTRLNAHVQKEAGDGDAVLGIVIVNESVVPGAAPTNGNPNKEWLFEVKISAALTRKDGQVVWSETDSGPRFSRKLAQTDPAGVWNDPIVRNSLTLALGNRLVYRMLYVH